ncbi:hypothetical protein MJT46_014329 [Ovis ammon polii x Ovis aries]|nr:hypothetical protein MJT46_014329 [Ovis ammon polii x Ovis aries]
MCAGPSCFLSNGDGCDENAGNSVPTKQGKDPSSRARRRKRGSPGCVRDPRASSGVETGLSHVHTWWESILGLNVKAVQGNRFLWNGLTHLGALGMVARPWRSSRLSCGERQLLRYDGNAGNSFPTKQGKDPSSRARRRKRGSPGYVRDPRASSRVETAPPLEMRRECRNSFPTKQGKYPSSRARRRKRGSPECVRDSRASSRVETMRREHREFFPYETGIGSLISSSEAENGLPWMCSGPSCFLSSGDGCDENAGNSVPTKQGKDPSSRARRRKRGSPGCVRDPRASSGVETGLSHVHTWWESILGLNVKAVQGNRFLWNGLTHLGALGMVARPWRSSRLSCGERQLLRYDGNAGNSFPTKQGKDPSSRARRRKRGSPGYVRDPRASSRVETGLSHVHTWWESILGLNVKAVQGKQVPLEWTDTSGGLLEWWHDPGVPLAFPVDSTSS